MRHQGNVTPVTASNLTFQIPFDGLTGVGKELVSAEMKAQIHNLSDAMTGLAQTPKYGELVELARKRGECYPCSEMWGVQRDNGKLERLLSLDWLSPPMIDRYARVLAVTEKGFRVTEAYIGDGKLVEGRWYGSRLAMTGYHEPLDWHAPEWKEIPLGALCIGRVLALHLRSAIRAGTTPEGMALQLEAIHAAVLGSAAGSTSGESPKLFPTPARVDDVLSRLDLLLHKRINVSGNLMLMGTKSVEVRGGFPNSGRVISVETDYMYQLRDPDGSGTLPVVMNSNHGDGPAILTGVLRYASEYVAFQNSNIRVRPGDLYLSPA